jgi:hypothetical protein
VRGIDGGREGKIIGRGKTQKNADLESVLGKKPLNKIKEMKGLNSLD